METPKEKALALVEKFYQNAPEIFGTWKAQTYAIESAKITVDEIIKEIEEIISISNYWRDVKEELNKL